MVTKKISVIVPCYNVEKYIDRCIRSLVKQTIGIKNIELILVDDASDDSTVDKLMVWEKRFPDSVVVICCKENGRQGKARNIGMEYVTTSYVSFVDADDWVEPAMLEDMFRVMEKSSVDIVIGQSGRDKGNGEFVLTFDEFADRRNQVVEVKNVAARKELLLYGIGAGIWGKLYRISFLKENHIRFLENTAYEDNYYVALIAAYVKSYYVLDGIYYHYFANFNSTITERNSEKHLERLEVELKTIDKLCEIGLEENFHQEIFVRFLRMYYTNSLHLIFERFDQLPYDILNTMKGEVLKRFPDYKTFVKNELFTDIEKGFLLTLEMEMSNELWDSIARNYRAIVETCG